VANKADKAASRGEIPIYRSWCPAAGESEDYGFSEIAAIDAATAARIHVERMPEAVWERTQTDPDEVCASCKNPRKNHEMRHPFKSSRRKHELVIKVLVDGAVQTFTVRRTMQPVFEVVE
jgi:hypothetical protein